MAIRLIVGILLSSALSGCVVWVEDTQDLTRFVAATKARPVGHIEPLPEYKPYQSFVYEGSSLREPFTPLQPLQAIGNLNDPQSNEATSSKESLRPDDDRERDYLEEFSLDDLIMVGTIRHLGNNTLWALVRDTNNAIHRVGIGSHMGLDYGEIVAIEERKLELVEIVSNGRGGWMKRPRVMALKQSAPGENRN